MLEACLLGSQNKTLDTGQIFVFYRFWSIRRDKNDCEDIERLSK